MRPVRPLAVERARLRQRHWKQRPDPIGRTVALPAGNVTPLRPRLDDGFHTSRPFDHLTTELVLAQYRAGTLPEAVIVALLAGAGLQP